jgi:hypothetical protein
MLFIGADLPSGANNLSVSALVRAWLQTNLRTMK